MKHILIGGNGFVGRYTACSLLEAGEQVLVCDLMGSHAPIHPRAHSTHVDVTDPASVASIPFQSDDIVYNFAARMLHPVVPRRLRHRYFYSVDYEGAINVISAMKMAGCRRLIQFSTDMVYGRPQTIPITPAHPRVPFGEYSASKKALEDYCIGQRASGLNVSIFRPRLINGPGRVGILGTLFRTIRNNLPLPLIGKGRNRYQMVSVFDCVNAAVLSARAGVVNGEFNLGSASPPTVRELLQDLIRYAGSRSVLLPMPANLTKSALRLLDRVNLPVLVPEQFEIADDEYVLDIEDTVRQLKWRPEHSDRDMMIEAYREFVSTTDAGAIPVLK